ncbi:hypothetical protein I6A60_11425 [Frankia sp. AgB1.9]|uniref:hypothetical protein n=1 Tax=unclassified Frankia TaxID=2632575 RepID=UPI001933A870|nr:MULTISPECIES: hypothetical protein [unclassified Frankia]MBL7490367.1 hypothetical protein [Frankia sp. AgW1.1]MBL7548477.1 hypothetical protein [Frankia sp. AgB1.9]MBL7618505.1 hypothetical protein [Frankia sp. AgB1.8]
MDLGIFGFGRFFLVGIESVRQAHGPRLARLAGRPLTGFAVVRFVEDWEWFTDCPVVLDFDGVQVEVCHDKFDELSVGWDTIDTAATITGWESSESTPQWSGRHEDLKPFVGQELREVALLEWRPAEHALAAGTVAVEFPFAGGRLEIFNGLDENRIEVGVAHPDYVRHRLDR